MSIRGSLDLFLWEFSGVRAPLSISPSRATDVILSLLRLHFISSTHTQMEMRLFDSDNIYRLVLPVIHASRLEGRDLDGTVHPQSRADNTSSSP